MAPQVETLSQTPPTQLVSMESVDSETHPAVSNLLSALLGSARKTGIFPHDKSIHTILEPFFSAPDCALDPCPTINTALSSLVSHLQGNHYNASKLFPTFAHLQQEACLRIDENPILLSRAEDIRSVATRAESRLELYYVKVLLNDNSIQTLSLSNMSYPDRILHAARLFPYVSNYAVMVDAEAAMLRKLLERRCPVSESHVVFCGSGPLPFTGLFLTAHLGCYVTLVDNDADAVELSSKLVAQWESNNVIPSGRVSIVHADCAELTLMARGQSPMGVDEEGDHGSKTVLRCDAIILAALIPNAAKESLAQMAGTLCEDGPVVALRSAHGLTARLAYYKTRRLLLGRYLEHLGTMVPSVHAFSNGEVLDDDRRPWAMFPTEILNSLELYGSKTWSENVEEVGTEGL